MVSLLLKELIHALATQQNQHQALVTLHNKQEQHFKALLQAQQEDHQAFQNLLASVVTQAAVLAGFPHTTLMKMRPHDDPEAFLVLFKQAVEVLGWRVEHRVTRLMVLLTGKAELTAQQLPANKRLEYAILQCVSCTPEQQHQCFYLQTLEDVGWLFAFGKQLQDAYQQ